MVNWFKNLNLAIKIILITGIIFIFITCCCLSAIILSPGFWEGFDQAIKSSMKDQISTTTSEKALSKTDKETTSTKQKKKEWQKITEFSGSGTKSTETFRVTEDEWRIKYEVNGENIMVFSLFIYPKGESKKYVDIVVATETTNDESYIYESGEFYLKINAANCSYRITIEEKR